MSDNYNPKSKFTKFLEGKGFYVALAVCVVGAGTAAWMAVNKTVSRIDSAPSSSYQQTQPTKEPAYGFPDLEEAGKAQSDIKVPSSPSSSSAPASSSSQASASSAQQPAQSPESEPSAEVKAQPTPQNSSFVLPISGEIFAPYSNGELVKSATLKEWRTHDGIDIKSDKGAPVKSVCDGTVSAVKDDPLMGLTIEVTHHDNIVSIYNGLDKKTSVKLGDSVQVGQQIGVVGEIPCEIAAEPHLHFAMKVGGSWADPLKVMGKTAS